MGFSGGVNGTWVMVKIEIDMMKPFVRYNKYFTFNASFIILEIVKKYDINYRK